MECHALVVVRIDARTMWRRSGADLMLHDRAEAAWHWPTGKAGQVAESTPGEGFSASQDARVPASGDPIGAADADVLQSTLSNDVRPLRCTASPGCSVTGLYLCRSCIFLCVITVWESLLSLHSIVTVTASRRARKGVACGCVPGLTTADFSVCSG